MTNNRKMQGVKRLLLVQLTLSVLIAVTVFAVLGLHQAISCFTGGMVAFLPSVLFARKFFRQHGARAAKQIVKNFYVGEFLKILSSIVLFSLVFLLYKVAPLAFFLSYIAVVMTHWFAPLIIDK